MSTEASTQMTELKKAVHFLDERFGAAPKLAAVLGSGLGSFSEELQSAESLSLESIPGANRSSVEGHRGELVVGHLEGHRIAVQSGRLHGFEGHAPNQVVFSLRALKLWGVKKFILTNATGATHSKVAPGALALLKDHINFTGDNPLVGKELYGGPRFPDMSDLYSKSWRELAKKVGKRLNLELPELVYIGVYGPNFETASEIKAFHQWGADIVGMSTVWEALALKQMGAELLGLSCVCNYGTGVSPQGTEGSIFSPQGTEGSILSHEEVLATGLKVETDFRRLLRELIRETLLA